MLLFKKAFHAGLVSGVVTLTYRRWVKPHVRAGGRYRCHPLGVLQVDAVTFTNVAAITQADAKLGLTQSFEIGYEVSPRGRAYLAANKSKLAKAKAKQ